MKSRPKSKRRIHPPCGGHIRRKPCHQPAVVKPKYATQWYCEFHVKHYLKFDPEGSVDVDVHPYLDKLKNLTMNQLTESSETTMTAMADIKSLPQCAYYTQPYNTPCHHYGSVRRDASWSWVCPRHLMDQITFGQEQL